MKTTVTIPSQELSVFAGQPVLIGTHILTRLKHAGIPVVGSLWPIGVERGEMHVVMNSAGLGYQWEDEDEQLF